MRKLFFLLLLSIFLIGSVSAELFKFDNVLSEFNKTANGYGIATIKNTFGIGSEIMKVELTSNTNFCLTKCSAEGTAKLYISTNLLDGMFFKDLNNGKDVQLLDYKIFIQNGTKEEKQPVSNCIENKVYNSFNKTDEIIKTCSTDFIKVKVPNWISYNGGVLKAGNYNWKIEGQKGALENIDWVGSFDGVKVNQWATWNSSFDNGLQMNFPLQSDLKDNIKFQNFTQQSGVAVYNATGGINGDSIYIDQNNKINLPYNPYLGSASQSVNFWMNNVGATAGKVWFNGVGYIQEGTGKYIWANICGTGVGAVTEGKHMMTITRYQNGSLRCYLDGGLDASDGVTYQTNITSLGFPYVSGANGGDKEYLGFVMVYNRTLAPNEVVDLYNGGVGLFMPNRDYTPIVTLTSPVNDTNFTTSSITFNCSGMDDLKINNISLWINGQINTTVTNGVTNFSELYLTKTIGDGFYNWTCSVDDNATLTQTAWGLNRTFNIDTGAPSIIIFSPLNQTYITNYTSNSTISIDLNATINDPHLQNCWIYNGTANVTITCGQNLTINTGFGAYNFIFYANDSLGNVASSPISANWIYNILQNSITFNSSTYETTNELFVLNISSLNPSLLTAINLKYNTYTYPFILQGNGIWKATIDVPSLLSNNSFYIQSTYNGFNSNSQNYFQLVNPVIFGLCNSSITIPYLNLTFKDEGNSSSISASIPASTFVYWLGEGTVNKTLIYSSVVQNSSYAFCLSPSDTILHSSVNLAYESTNYPQRILKDIFSLTNTTLNKTLYLLSSANGIYVTFQIYSAGNQPINGVNVIGTRDISGATVTVAQGITDSAGSVTFWLNPDFLHTFNFTKIGYDTGTTSLYPTQTLYTITLGGISTYSNVDYTRGIRMVILPTSNSLLNGTTSFNYTISTNYWTLDGFGFVLSYANGTIIGTQTSTSSTGGTLNLNMNVPTSGRIIMNYYYIINSSYSNYTRYWNTYTSNSFSISHFFSDLNLYIGANMFGINGDDGDSSFGKALIGVLILVMVAGSLSYRYGINSEPAVMGMIFGLILILNSLGFIPNPTFTNNSILNLGDLIAFLVMLLTVGFIIKGEAR